MIERVNSQMDGMVFSEDMESLNADLSAFESEYERVTDDLSSLREKLMRLRRERADRVRSIEGAAAFTKRWESGYRRLRKRKQCPLCHSVLEDELEVRVEECETREDVLFVKLEMERDLKKIEGKIAILEDDYRELLAELEPIRAEIRAGEAERNKVAAIDGLVQMRDELVKERSDLADDLLEKKG